MKDDERMKEQLVHELSALRSQNAELKKSTMGIISIELAAEQARYYAESIVETIREPLLILDADLKIVSANRNFYTTFKVTPSETIGSLIYDLGNKQWDIPDLRKLLEEVLPEKQAFDDFEVDHIFQDIGHKIMLLNACRIHRKDIGAKMILLAIEDITERKRLENLLIDSELQYRRLFETASDAIVLLEKSEGKITHANPAAENMLGYSHKESIGSKLPDIGVSLDMDDFQTTMQNLNKSGIINYRNVTVETKSGQHMDTEVYLVDRAKLVQCNIRDITERKVTKKKLQESEDRYRSLFENSIDAILLTVPDGKITAANPEACRIFDRTEEEICQIERAGLVDQTDPRLKAALEERKRTGRFRGELTFVRENGTHFSGEISSSIFNDRDGKQMTSMIIRDITERKEAEDKIKNQTDAMESAIDGIAILDKDEQYTYLNQAHARVYGYKNTGELIGKSWRILYDSVEIKRFDAEIMPKFSQTGYWQGEALGMKKDGSKFPQETSLTALDSGGMICIVRDITDRKQAEEALKESENKYRLIAENMTDVITIMDMNLRFTYVSPSIIRMRGYTVEETMEQSLEQVMTPESLQISAKVFEEEMQRETSGTADPNRVRTIELEEYRKDMSTVWVEVTLSFLRDADGRPIGILSLSRDITDRKRTEEALRESEEKYRWVLNNMADVITVMDMNLRFTYVSPSIIRMRGYTAEEAMAQTFEQVMTPESLQISARVFEEELELEASGKADPDRIRIVEVEQYRKDGTIVLMENHLSFMRDESKKAVGIISVSHDITERKQAETALREKENKYRLLAENVNDVIFVLDMNLNYTYVSPSVKFLRGYDPEEVLKQQPSEVLAPSSLDLAMKVLSEIMELGKSKPSDMPISRTLQLEMIRKDGSTVWTEVKFSFIRDENQLPVGILGLTRGITERMQAEEKLKQTLESLRKAVATTIQVMVSAVEARDPYTAGHQVRVADLACAIATDMGLPQEQIDGIHMAGTIHDLGKLSIPAEILSKPTKLSEIEFSLIKEHSRSGYEILKNVESAWPLAQIVYQHHERMDGSGYPRKLKGKEILIEARILSVADVVEAMASHRPYRPGLGIDIALEEISKNRGILYDPNVADACLRLFHEKGYKID